MGTHVFLLLYLSYAYEREFKCLFWIKKILNLDHLVREKVYNNQIYLAADT